MLHSLSRALHEEVRFDAEKQRGRLLSSIRRSGIRHACEARRRAGNGDTNPKRPDLPHYGAGRDRMQAADRGGRQRIEIGDSAVPPLPLISHSVTVRGVERLA